MLKKNILEESSSNDLTLSISEKIFADMILNFLGNKQVLSYELENEIFILERNHLEQFYYFMDQKIRNEHLSSLDYFSVIINYSDNTSREIIGIEALNTFLETRDVIPRSITLLWNIILKYTDSPTIENQKIELLFNIVDSEKTEISLRIEHTDQRWGIEILNLLKDNLQTIILHKINKLKKAEKIKKIFQPREFIVYLAYPLTLIFFLLTLYENSDKRHTDHSQSLTIEKIFNIAKDEKSSSESLVALYMIDKNFENVDLNMSFSSEKMNNTMKDFVINNHEKRLKELEFLSVMVLSIPLMFFGVYLYITQIIKYHGSKSFIKITKRAENEYRNYLSEKSKGEYISISIIAISIMCSIAASFIYEIFSTFVK
ncbi:MAG: hypothetical protein NTY39_09455 [Campylobacterales bacterium]|nr:hypothetical protein [Campylobacterales bacterium]